MRRPHRNSSSPATRCRTLAIARRAGGRRRSRHGARPLRPSLWLVPSNGTLVPSHCLPLGSWRYRPPPPPPPRSLGPPPLAAALPPWGGGLGARPPPAASSRKNNTQPFTSLLDAPLWAADACHNLRLRLDARAAFFFFFFCAPCGPPWPGCPFYLFIYFFFLAWYARLSTPRLRAVRRDAGGPGCWGGCSDWFRSMPPPVHPCFFMRAQTGGLGACFWWTCRG